MAIKIECDGGCGATIPVHPRSAQHGDGCQGCRAGHDGRAAGLLDPVVYCDACHAAWQAYEAQEREARLRAVAEFEQWRRQARQVIRRRLARLPDDWDADGGATGGVGDLGGDKP